MNCTENGEPTSLPWKDFGFNDYETLSEEKRMEAGKAWEEVLAVIHGIGNLSLSTIDSNSADSNGKPTDHVATYTNAGLYKTAELVASWNDPKEFVNKINERSDIIINHIAKSVINNDSMWN